MKEGYSWETEEILKRSSTLNIFEFVQCSSLFQIRNKSRSFRKHDLSFNYIEPFENPSIRMTPPSPSHPPFQESMWGNRYLHGSKSATSCRISTVFLEQAPSLSCSDPLTVLFPPGWVCDQVWHVSSAEDSVSPYASQRDPSHRWFWER